MKVLLYAAFRRDCLELRLGIATGLRFLAVIAAGSHPFPYRTRQLSPPAPMVVGPQGPSRVGRRQIKQGSPLGRNRSAGFFIDGDVWDLAEAFGAARAQRLRLGMCRFTRHVTTGGWVPSAFSRHTRGVGANATYRPKSILWESVGLCPADDEDRP